MKRLLLVLILIYGCGYKFTGQSDADWPVNLYYINSIVNVSNDYTINAQVRRDVSNFFYTSDKATRIMDIKIIECTVEEKLTSVMKESVKSELVFTLEILVSNPEGVILYDKKLTNIQSFTTGTNVTRFNNNKSKALSDAVNEILTRFRYEFE